MLVLQASALRLQSDVEHSRDDAGPPIIHFKLFGAAELALRRLRWQSPLPQQIPEWHVLLRFCKPVLNVKHIKTSVQLVVSSFVLYTAHFQFRIRIVLRHVTHIKSCLIFEQDHIGPRVDIGGVPCFFALCAWTDVCEVKLPEGSLQQQ